MGMIKGEMGALKKKQAEEERRRQMAEGLAKFQAILAQAAAEREAAFNANEEAKAKIAAIKGEMEFLGSYAHEQAEQIKAAEVAADGAAASLASVTAAIDSERATLKSTLAKNKDDLVKELAAAKDTLVGAAGGYQKLKGKAIALEADKTAMKGQVSVIADAIAALDKKAAAALIEKREMWSTISACKFTSSNHQSFLRL